MEKVIDLVIIPADGDRLLAELARGRMVAVRSKCDFLYVLESRGGFHLFSHTVGLPQGGQKQVPKDEEYTAVIRNLGNLADAAYSVGFDRRLSLYGVMESAEEGILSTFPIDDLEGMIEFIVPGRAKTC